MANSKKHVDGRGINVRTDADVQFSGPNLKGDWTNLFLLLLLYVMQGVPLGISSAVPLFIQSNKNVTFSDQALFSVSEYPFSLKILWAPIVDTIYVQRFGRRKSWLVPTQYLIVPLLFLTRIHHTGMVLAYVAWEIDYLLPENGKPNIIMLTCVFVSINFFVAVQDIVVDGWSLTMLKKSNVGYAAICNLTGQAIGMLLGNIPLFLLTSENFCNKYLRTSPVRGEGGILTMKSIICGWSVVFIMITTLVALFKKEKDCTLEDNYVKINVLQNYSLLWYILKLPSFQIMAIVLVTVKIGFVPASTEIMNLKLIKASISRDVIASISSSLSGITVFIPIAIGKFISGSKTLNLFLQSTIFRLPMNVASALLIYYTPILLSEVNGTVLIPTYYYAILVIIFLTQNIVNYTTVVPLLYFFSQISDSRFGGTYMTLLNTLINFGGRWTTTLALALLDVLTFKNCSDDPTNICCSAYQLKTCGEDQGESKRILVDGYYVETLLCTIVGIVWYFIFRNKVKSLQTINASDWMVDVNNVKTGKNSNDLHSADESPL